MAKKARKPKLKRSDLPQPGEAFLMPLDDGRFGVCRVLRHSTEAEEKRQGAPHALAAASSWIGSEPPEIDDPRLRDLLILTHHSFTGRPEILWISEPVPTSFRPLGVIEPSADEARMEWYVSSGWGSFPLQLFSQWRWDHDRENVQREDTAKQDARTFANRDAAQQRRAYLDGLTLAGLRKKRRFTAWNDLEPDGAAKAARAILAQTIDALIALPPDSDQPATLEILKQCVLDFNDLDDRLGHFIETSLREEISEEIGEIAYVVGFQDDNDLAGRWRDW
jgi:hypothetical protein